jgi:aconitate hydratase
VRAVSSTQYDRVYRRGALGDPRWPAIACPQGDRFVWDPASSFLSPGRIEAAPIGEDDTIEGMRLLAVLGAGVTTDALLPNSEILPGSPAGTFLAERGVVRADFGNYAARRGHFEIALRGMFANPHLENELVAGRPGGLTLLMPEREIVPIFEAGTTYRSRGVATIIVAGERYGSGSSRDWAAKGIRHLGARAVLAESFESIHRANLVNVGVLPLLFPSGHGRRMLALDGSERLRVRGLRSGIVPGGVITVDVIRDDADTPMTFSATLAVWTEQEAAVLRAGGLLNVLLAELSEASDHTR